VSPAAAAENIFFFGAFLKERGRERGGGGGRDSLGGAGEAVRQYLGTVVPTRHLSPRRGGGSEELKPS
jgi:hypothetical protein